MKPSKDILNELKGIAPALAGLDRRNFYQVPDGYFDESSSRIAILAEDVSAHEVVLPRMLAAVPKVIHQAAPKGYFMSFSDELNQRIHAEEIGDELSYAAPILTGLSKAQRHEVPANYFAVFPMAVTRVALKAAMEHDSPIEHKISNWSLWIERVLGMAARPKHAFAMACMAASIVVMGIVLMHSTLTPEEKIFAQMQQVPDSELHSYMGKHRDDFDEHTLLHHINNIEFTHYFDKAEDMPAHLKSIGNAKESTDNIGEDVID